jgi:hypothetical protein
VDTERPPTTRNPRKEKSAFASFGVFGGRAGLLGFAATRLAGPGAIDPLEGAREALRVFEARLHRNFLDHLPLLQAAFAVVHAQSIHPPLGRSPEVTEEMTFQLPFGCTDMLGQRGNTIARLSHKRLPVRDTIQTDWTDHGVKTDNVFVDARPPAETNKPELRRYRQIYVKNDQPVGLWSDAVSVTVQP